MIGNLLNILVGLWLAYSAIFANPSGAVNNAVLAAAGVAVIVFAVWARRTDLLGWQSGTNIVLAALLLAVAVARWGIGVAPLVCSGLSCSSASRSRLWRCGLYSIGLKRLGLPRLRKVRRFLCGGRGCGDVAAFLKDWAKNCASCGPSSCSSERVISPSALAPVARAPRFPAD
jgi:hypothetical protein